MPVPFTVTAGRRIFVALEAGDVPAALAAATRAGKKRIEKILSTPGDERAVLLLAKRNPGLMGRVDFAAKRAMCKFADVGGRAAVLDLVPDEDGVWRIDDVRIVDDFWTFGVPDEPPPMTF